VTDLDLFAPIARASDPETSHAGADRIAPKRGTDAARVYAWYLANPSGATAKEYAQRTKHDGGWKRVSDLLRKGLLRETGEVRDGGRVLVAVDNAILGV
jgi:hypothetical protein